MYFSDGCNKADAYNWHFWRIYFLFRIAHLLYVGFVLLGDLLGCIGEELKIQKLPAKVPGVISIYFRSESCRARQLLTPLATFAFLLY